MNLGSVSPLRLLTVGGGAVWRQGWTYREGMYYGYVEFKMECFAPEVINGCLGRCFEEGVDDKCLSGEIRREESQRRKATQIGTWGMIR